MQVIFYISLDNHGRDRKNKMANFGNVQNLPFSFFSVRGPNLFLLRESFRNGERHFQLRLLAFGLRSPQHSPVVAVFVQLR